jgi:beta-glucosidase
VTPVFPFGHGLSYTTFRYDALTVSPVMTFAAGGINTPLFSVAVKLTNTGSRDGDEVVQLYLSFPRSAVGEPPKQLKNFAKVAVAKGQSTEVSLTLTQRDLSIWDAETHDWVQPRGEFAILVGGSAADVRLSQTLTL